MNDEKWNQVLIEWVNCLKLGKNINCIDELRNGEFFSNLQKVITKSRNVQLDLLTFIFDLFAKHYPNFTFENKTEIHLSDLAVIDLKSVTSLLMHYTCMYDRKDVLTSPLCHSLSQTTQLIIRNYLEKVTKDVTNLAMNDIIKSCIDDASDHLTNHRWLSTETSQNKNSPLQDLLKTPVSKFGRLYEKDKIIFKLKSELESERYDKAELQEELKSQLEKNKRIEQQLSQKSNEVSRLKAEVVSLENRTPPHYQDMDSRELQRRLRGEIQSLEQYIKQIENEQEKIRREKDNFSEQLRKVERQSSIWEEKFFETERNFENLNEHSKKQEEELLELRTHCSEITALLEEYKSKPANDSSLYDTFTLGTNDKALNEALSCEDLACSVVEVQLRDAQKQNEELVIQIQHFEEREVQWKNAIAEIEEKLKKSEGFNEELILKIQILETNKESIEKRLVEVQNDFIEGRQKIQEITAELQNVIMELHEKSQSLQEVSNEKEELILKVQLLHSHNDNIEKTLSEALSNWETEKKRSDALEQERNDAITVSEKLQFELADAVLNNQKINLERDGLKIENEILVKDLKEKENICRDFEIRLNESCKFVDNLKAECDCLQRENQTFKEEVSMTKIRLTILEGEKVELISNLKQQDELSNSLKKTNENLDAEVVSLQKQLTETLEVLDFSQKRIKQLEENETVLDKQLNELQKALENLTAANAKLQNDKEQIYEKLNETERHITTLEEEKVLLYQQLKDLEESCHNLKESNKDLLLKNDVLHKELQDTHSYLETNKIKLEELRNIQNSLKTQLEESQTISETLKKDREQCQIDIQKVREKLEVKEIELQKSEELCCHFKQKNEDFLLLVQGLQKELFDTKADLKLYKEDLRMLADNRNLLETKLAERDASLEMLRNDLHKVEQEKQNLIEELDDCRDQCNNLEQEKISLVLKLEETEAMYHSISDESKREVADLQEQLTEAYRHLKLNSEESKELRKMKTELEIQLEESQDAAAALKTELEKLQCENRDLNECLNKSCESSTLLKEEKGVLLAKLEEVEKENEKFSLHSKNLTEQLTAALDSLKKAESLEIALDESNTLCKNLKCEIEEIKFQHKHSVEAYVTLNAEKTYIENRLQELEAARDSLEQKLSATEEYSKDAVEKLQVENSCLSDNLEKTKNSLLKLEEERNVLSTKAEDLQIKNEELLVSVESLEAMLSEERKIAANGKYMQDTLEKKIVDLWASLEESQFSKQKINDALLNLGNENQMLMSKLQDCDAKYANLERQMCDVIKRKSELEMNVETLTVELDYMKSERQKTVSRLNESEENRNKLENEKEILICKVKDLEEKSNNLEKRNQNLLTQNCNLEKHIEESKLEYDELECLHQKFKGTAEELMKEIEQIRNESKWDNETLTSQLAELEEKWIEAENHNDELQLQNQNLQQQNEDLIIKNDQIILENEKYKDSLEGLLTEKTKSENEMMKEKETLTENLLELKQKSEQIEKQNEELILENESLQRQISEMKTFEEQSEHDLQNTKEFLKDLASEKEDLELKMMDYHKNNEDLRKQNEEIQRQLSIFETNHKELKNNKETIERKLNEVSILSETLKVEAEEIRLQYQKCKAELEKAKDATKKLTNENENLTLALKEENVRNEGLMKEISEVTGSLQTEREKIICMENKEMEVKETLNKLQNENRMLISKNEMLQQNIIDIENTNKKNRDLLEAEVSKLTSSVTDYKNELESVLKRANEAEQNCEHSKNELLAISERVERLSEQNSVLEKKLEVEEMITSQNHERVKSLEETIQDYEITISGLKSVVDTNLESIEILREELSRKKDEEADMMKLFKGLLKENNIICDEQEQGDFKTFISENLTKILKGKSEEEKRITQFEIEIKELKIKNANLMSSFAEMVKKLQVLVLEESEINSIESSFERIHTKVIHVLQNKEEMSASLLKAENEKLELDKQIEVLRSEKEELNKIKAELESNLKDEKEKTKNLCKEVENKLKVDKPEKENILGVSTKSNKAREEELKKENMMLKRKVVLTENAKNNLEKVLKELREEKKKAVAIPSSPSNDGLYKKLLQEYIQVKEDHERIVKEKDDKIETLTRENEQMKTNNVQIKVEDDKKLVQDLHNIREAYGNIMSVNSKLELEIVTLRKVIEERNSEMANLSHVKEAYEKLLEENNKLMTEVDTVKYKRMRDKEECVRLLKREREENANREMKRIQEIRYEYEGKLEKMKDKMLKLYREEVNKKVKSVKDGQNESAHLLKTVANLKSELFEADQKIQLLEMEKEMLKANRRLDVETRSVQMQSTSSVTSIVANDERATTLPRPTITKEITISQRTSIGGISNCIAPQNLQMEDEEDLFNDKYLTDLKEGRCALPADRESTTRFSELAWRNSMVPPHLKSSYPAEMQFISPSRFKDEDIKTGNIEFEDSLCKLLPGEKPRKKDFGTTSYKRPGPPTPSKNGGRLSLQGNEVHPMREHCETKTPKKSTPSRIRALFSGRTNSTKDGSDSQSNVTPSRKRLSIFRRPR